MNKIRKTVMVISITAIVAGFVALSVYALSAVWSPPKQTVSTAVLQEAPQIEQNPELLAVLQSMGATYTSDLSIAYSNDIPSRGQYTTGLKRVLIRPDLDAVQARRSIAHEYLHHVWYTVMSEDTHTELTSKMYTLYLNDPEMQVRTDYYETNNNLVPAELFSLYCTESTDGYMLSIVDDCNKYFDRSTIQLLR